VSRSAVSCGFSFRVLNGARHFAAAACEVEVTPGHSEVAQPRRDLETPRVAGGSAVRSLRSLETTQGAFLKKSMIRGTQRSAGDVRFVSQLQTVKTLAHNSLATSFCNRPRSMRLVRM